jgi:hypothetical protein
MKVNTLRAKQWSPVMAAAVRLAASEMVAMASMTMTVATGLTQRLP